MKQGLYRKVIVFSLIFSLLLPITAGNSVSAASPDLDSTVPIVDEVSTEAPAADTFEPVETEPVAEVASNSEDFADAVNLSAGQTVTVNITAAYEKEYYKFTPTATGLYTLKSSNCTGDPILWLYNTNQVQMAIADDSYSGLYDEEDQELQQYNFILTYHFIKDVTYYIAVGQAALYTGSYSFVISSNPYEASLNSATAKLGTSYTVDTSVAYTVKFYSVLVPAAGSYIFQSSPDGGDAKIWIYNVHHSLVAQDDNSGGSYRFRAEVTAAAANTRYYIVVGHAGTATGTYNFTPLMPITNVAGVNHLENIGTGKYLEIHGPAAQELAHQWSLHTGAQQRWEFKKQTNGYYTIQSQYGNKYYLAVSNTSNGVNNVVLRSSVTDYALWKIYGNSNGELLIEPKSAPGKVLCAPNSAEGTELQLCWMHSAVSNRNKWQISARWGVQLEGQMMSNWCWAASARMFAGWDNGSGNSVPSGRTQENAVTKVKGSFKNEGGTNIEAMYALRYYYTGETYYDDRDYTYMDGCIFEEAMLRRFLDEGRAVYITRIKREMLNNLKLGHASIIGGYTSCVVGNTLTYQYIIFDPLPADSNYSWEDTPQETTGHIYTASYQWLKTGQKLLTSDKTTDYKLWWGFLTRETTYSTDTIPAGLS